MSTRACFIEHAGYVRIATSEHENPDMRYEQSWFALKAVISGMKNKDQVECLARIWACTKCMGVSYEDEVMVLVNNIALVTR